MAVGRLQSTRSPWKQLHLISTFPLLLCSTCIWVQHFRLSQKVWTHQVSHVYNVPSTTKNNFGWGNFDDDYCFSPFLAMSTNSRFWLECCYISTFDFNLDLDKWVIIIFVFGFCIFGDFLYYTPERFYKSQPNGLVLSPIFAECVLLPQSNPLPFSIFFLIPSRTCRQVLPSVSILVYSLLDDQK